MTTAIVVNVIGVCFRSKLHRLRISRESQFPMVKSLQPLLPMLLESELRDGQLRYRSLRLSQSLQLRQAIPS